MRPFVNALMLGRNGVFGEASYVAAGTYQWTCPPGVFFVCAVCVGGAGLAGGGLGWKNNIPVVPGQSYTVVVGGNQADSYFISATTVKGGKAGGNTSGFGTFVGDGGGNGGRGGGTASGVNGGGGGAGGYSGAGGDAGGNGTSTPQPGDAGTGGAGGGGGSGANPGGGGGVGLLGQGANGSGGAAGNTPGNSGSAGVGRGGSGGANGSTTSGGIYGGGAAVLASNGRPGAVRLIWGPRRAFPATRTGTL